MLIHIIVIAYDTFYAIAWEGGSLFVIIVWCVFIVAYRMLS